MKSYLFVCVHNAGRSVMAEAFTNSLANGKAEGISAGTIPQLTRTTGRLENTYRSVQSNGAGRACESSHREKINPALVRLNNHCSRRINVTPTLANSHSR